jgi:hypothetical protein
MDDPLFFKALNRANAMRNAILNAEIIAYEIDADAEDDNVIEIFARLNQQGVRLRPGDLAAARLTGTMADFRKKAAVAIGSPGLAAYCAAQGEEEKHRAGALVDTDLMVRTAMFLGTGLLRYRDVEKRNESRKRKADDDAYKTIEPQWDNACKGLEAAVSHFRGGGIPSGDWLPYRYLLLVPAIAEAKGHHLGSDFWLGWAIAASLWGHYAGSAETTAQSDAKLAAEGNKNALIDSVKSRAKRVDSIIPQEDDFTGGVVDEGGTLLGLLVHLIRNDAWSFPSKRRIAVHVEPLEAHHLFPRAHLDRAAPSNGAHVVDRLGNLTLLYKSDNASVNDSDPAKYLEDWDDKHLALHCIPSDRALWTVDRYEEFCLARETALAAVVAELLHDLGMNGSKSSKRSSGSSV